MDIQQGYNEWASQYDTSANKTRDLEGVALRSALENLAFAKCLEIGCGTGKNTVWLAKKAHRVTAVDFSEQMLTRARDKVMDANVRFIQADITTPWTFMTECYDIVTFSLVLEHIENLDHIFNEAANALCDDGHLYLGELHPFKQYGGSKARFETTDGPQILQCFTHHISDFVNAARRAPFNLVSLNEHFDEGSELPRVLSMIFQKSK